MKEKVLELKELCFSYDGIRNALDKVSVSIYAGEKIAVLGANGAGKSTFFLHLNGVRQCDSGQIILNSEVIETKADRRKLQQNVGIVFQDTESQLIASTVKAEVAFGPMNMGISREEVERNTMSSIKQMDLLKYIDRPPHYLSGGEKKRVGIADILAMKPRIIVFDEPTAALDPVNAQMLEEVLQTLEKEGKTIILSTHDVDFAYRFAERIIVFCGGNIIADDVPEEIFQDEELLKIANLKKPSVMQFYDMLRGKGFVQQEAYPRSIEELQRIL